MKLDDAEHRKIILSLVPNYSKKYQVCFSICLFELIWGTLNYFNIIGTRDSVLLTWLLIICAPLFCYGIMYLGLVSLVYKGRFTCTKGLISNYKEGSKKSNVFLLESEIYIENKIPIKLGFEEQYRNLEGKPCFFIEFDKNRKVLVLR